MPPRKKTTTLPPIDPKNFDLGPGTPELGDSSAIIFHDMQNNNVTTKLKDEVESLCQFYVNKYIWRKTKFDRYKNSKERASLELMHHAKFQFLRNKPPPVVKYWKKRWIQQFGPSVAKAINKRRSDVTQGVKAAIRDYYDDKGSLPTIPQLESILKRDFDPDDEDMCQLMEWYWDSLIPKVAGNDWDEDKRYFGLMHRHFEGNDPNKVFIHTSTEAFAVWTCLLYTSDAADE